MLRFVMCALLLLSADLALADDCLPTPYVITFAGGQVQVQATLPSALAKDATKPDLKANLAYAKTVYAAMGPSVVREIMEAYTCRVYQRLNADTSKSADERRSIKEAWDAARSHIETESSLYFVAFKSGVKDAQDVLPTEKVPLMTGNDWRSPAPYLAAIPIENFDTQTTWSGYVGGTFKGITATACGQYLRSALAANAGQIQHLAASIRPMLTRYFDNTAYGPRNALADLFGEAAGVQLVNSPVDAAANASLKNCT